MKAGRLGEREGMVLGLREAYQEKMEEEGEK